MASSAAKLSSFESLKVSYFFIFYLDYKKRIYLCARVTSLVVIKGRSTKRHNERSVCIVKV